MSYYFNPHGHQCPWYPYSELLGYPSASRCEEVACYLMSEPVNTMSAGALVLVAVICSSFRLKKNHPDIGLFSNIFLLSGIFIALFHVTNNFATQLLAHGSLFFLIMIGVVKNLIRMGKLNYNGRTPTLLSSLLVFLLISFVLYKKHLFPEIILPLTFLIAVITDFMAKKFNENNETSGTLFLAFVLFLLASASIYLDQIKFNCEPNSYYQLHSLGHLFLALSMGFYFRHLYQFYPHKIIKEDVDLNDYETEEFQEENTSEDSADEELVYDIEEDEFIEEMDENDDEVDDVQIEFDFDSGLSAVENAEEDDSDEENEEEIDEVHSMDELTDSLNENTKDEEDPENKG